MGKWYENHDIDGTPIISSRIRLARNVSKYPFPSMLSDNDAGDMIQEIASAVRETPNPLSTESTLLMVNDFSGTEKQVLVEQHILSPALAKSGKLAAVMKHENDSVSVMLNEEDHIRISSVSPGNGIDNAWHVANMLDDAIEQSVDYAFDKEFGYLTACPTNTGTGLRASFMAHLPMLERTGHLKNLIPAISKFGMTVRGHYGEATEPAGSIYQISNQVTLGKSEAEIIAALKNVTKQVTDHESSLLEKAIKMDRAALEDSVYRSYGVLCHCRKITSKEAMSLLSNVRLGFMTGLLREKKPTRTMYGIMMSCQPGSLAMSRCAEPGAADRDVCRAAFIRETIQS